VPEAVRCVFLKSSTRILYSRVPLVPTPARLKLVHAYDQWYSSRVVTLSPLNTVNSDQTLKVGMSAVLPRLSVVAVAPSLTMNCVTPITPC
jgi:hypothetical protein